MNEVEAHRAQQKFFQLRRASTPSDAAASDSAQHDVVYNTTAIFSSKRGTSAGKGSSLERNSSMAPPPLDTKL